MEKKMLVTMIITVFAWSMLLLLVTGKEIGASDILGSLAGVFAGALLVMLILQVVKQRREHT